MYFKTEDRKGEELNFVMRNEKTDNREGVFDVVYKMINNKANSNAFIQGISGIAGFPATIAIDVTLILMKREIIFT